MVADIHWNIDGDILYMEATDSENGLTLGQNEERLQYATFTYPVNGYFQVDQDGIYRAPHAEVTHALNDFANYYREVPLYFNH